MKFSRMLAAVTAVATAFLGLSAAQASDALVTTEWLEKNFKDPKVRVIEVSVNPGVFERAHVPGAANFVWHTDLADPVRRDIVSKDNLQKLLRDAGVNQDSTVVLYGDTNNWFAAWGAWVFDIYGVKNVKLLDGGRKKWEAENRELSSQFAAAKPGNVVLADANLALRARLADVLASAEKKSNAKLIDIRSPDEFNGKIIAPAGIQELAIRAGHVPGAAAVAEDGTFKSAADLKALYAAKGIDGSTPVITYCRIGERSSHTWFALVKILGYDVRNYDGSWTEYGNSVGVPITNVAGMVWKGK